MLRIMVDVGEVAKEEEAHGALNTAVALPRSQRHGDCTHRLPAGQPSPPLGGGSHPARGVE